MHINIHLLGEQIVMKDSDDENYAGLGRLERKSLAALLHDAKGAITISQAAHIWSLTRSQAAKRLFSYNRKGWLKRIDRGVYIPVPLNSLTSDVVSEEPYAIAAQLFSPCYIGGMNAANYWDLTEQLFRTVTIMTEKVVSNRTQTIGGTEYVIHTLQARYFFGLKSVWLSGVKVKISNPTRTLLDMLMFPAFCGGLRFINDVLLSYINSDSKNINLLIEYLEKANNGAALKRLGFLLELNNIDELQLIEYCSQNLSAGYAKLNPAQSCTKLVTCWRLWVPETWKEKFND
jgi:predicted transcriptional regulator of viral defense system